MSIDDVVYHLDNINCTGCHKGFCITCRNPDNEDETYCANCFGHVIGLDAYQVVLGSMDDVSITVWHTPTGDLPKDVLEQFEFIKKSRNIK